MSKVIHKHMILTSRQIIDSYGLIHIPIPSDANILSAGLDKNRSVCIWEIHEDRELDIRRNLADFRFVDFLVVGTGISYDHEGFTYLNSYMALGWFIGHVFWREA